MTIEYLMNRSVKPIEDIMNGYYRAFIPTKGYKKGYSAIKYIILHCPICGSEQVRHYSATKRKHMACQTNCRKAIAQRKNRNKTAIWMGRLITFDNVPKKYRDESCDPVKSYIKDRKRSITPEHKLKRVKTNKNLKALNEWNDFESKSTKDTLKSIRSIEENGDIFYCYTITNKENSKVYVGISKHYKLRKRQHKSVAFRKTDPQYYSRLYCAMRKYGLDAFDWKIVKSATNYKEICLYEINLIDKLNSMNRNYGYNQSKGGSGAYGAVRSKKTKAKLSVITKKQMTPEARAHLSRVSKKNWQDPDYRKRFEEGVKKKKQTYNLSGLKEFYKKNPDANARHATKKPCDYNGVKYCSIAEAARQNNMAETTIRRKVNIKET